jgi:hypothetical protein
VIFVVGLEFSSTTAAAGQNSKQTSLTTDKKALTSSDSAFNLKRQIPEIEVPPDNLLHNLTVTLKDQVNTTRVQEVNEDDLSEDLATWKASKFLRSNYPYYLSGPGFSLTNNEMTFIGHLLVV